MNRFGIALMLVLGAQGVVAEPSVPGTEAALPLVNEPAAAVVVKLAESESRMQARVARKLQRSVEEAIGYAAGQGDVPETAVGLTMGH